MNSPKLTLFCLLSVLALPFTVLAAILAALGGDALLLRVMRGKAPSESVDNNRPTC